MKDPSEFSDKLVCGLKIYDVFMEWREEVAGPKERNKSPPEYDETLEEISTSCGLIV